MLHSDFWEQGGLTVDKLPSLQELLKYCDEDLFVHIVWDEYVTRDWAIQEIPSKRQHSMKKHIRSALGAMKTLPVKQKKGRNRIILPAETFILQENAALVERQCSARLLFNTDTDVARAMLRAKEGPSKEAAKLPVHSYALDPWEVVLASRVCLSGSWCTYERYLALASAFWEMTFFGFAHDKVIAAQMHAKAEQVLQSTAICKRHERDGRNGRNGEGERCERSERSEGCERGEGQPVTISQWCEAQRDSFGLAVPHTLQLEYRDGLVAWVGRLNYHSELDLCKRFLQVVH